MTALEADIVLQTDPNVHVTPYGADEIFVRRGSRSTYSRVIRDSGRRRMLAPLVTELTRSATLDELRGRWPGRESDVDEILAMLEEEEIVGRRPSGAAAAARLARPLVVLGDGAIASIIADIVAGEDRGPVAAFLEDADVPGASTNGGPPPPTHAVDLLDSDLDEVCADARLVVLATDHLRPALGHAVNEWAAQTKQPWLNVTTDGTELLVGPIVVPGQTACFNCLEIQDDASRQHRNHFLVYKDSLSRETAHRPPVSSTAAHLAASWGALAVAQMDATGQSFLIDRLLRIDLDRMHVITQRVFPIPRCPVCLRTRRDPRHVFL